MNFNWLGLASASATFFGIWIGHVAVRKIEREVDRIWIPSTFALLFGIGLVTASLLTSNLILSTICGILAVTFFWDALELAIRQPSRVKNGHAPADPNNPRHTRILSAYPSATTFDWLDREPRGYPYSKEELSTMKEMSK